MESPHTLVQGPVRGDAGGDERPRRRIARGPSPAERERAVAAGELVLGRYRLGERLGAGGFGVVWRAHDELLHRDVAVKRIHIGPDCDSERATREALAAARLAHPAIVALYEACVVEDACYLISELVDGETLAQLIAAGDAGDEQVLEIGLALAAALQHAHARGVIHRDIKPQNVLIPADSAGGDGEAAKLTDFGGASIAGEEALTRTGDVLGTLAYMAPEQCDGAEAGEEADLYALALVLYEALSGTNPVRGPTPAATARRIGSRLEPLRRVRREVPRGLADALDDALRPEPQERGTLAELTEALQHALAGLPDSHRRAHSSAPAPARRAPLMPRAASRSRRGHADGPDDDALAAAAEPTAQESSASARRAPTLPRTIWLACTLALAGWQAAAGRPGVGLLVLAVMAPALALAGDPRSGRLGFGWLAAAIAPALGLVGLAGAYPAVAGQPSRWRERALLGALGYWWLALAEPLAARRLWLGVGAPWPPRAAWEGSIELTVQHVLAPALTTGMALGALLWAAAAVSLPWIVRGRSAVQDLLAAAVWSAALVVAAPLLAAGVSAGAPQRAGAGAVLGAVIGGFVAVAARALRGPA